MKLLKQSITTVFDGVFKRDDVVVAVLVDEIHDGGQRGGFTGTLGYFGIITVHHIYTPLGILLTTGPPFAIMFSGCDAKLLHFFTIERRDYYRLVKNQLELSA